MPEEQPRDLEFFLTLTLAASRAYPLVEREFRGVGVDPTNWGLLVHVAAGDPATPTRLSDETGISTTTIRDQVQSLVDRGVLERRSNPLDARSYLLILTERGRREVELGLVASARAREAIEARFGSLEPLRLELQRLLNTIAAVLEEATVRERAALIADALREEGGQPS